MTPITLILLKIRQKVRTDHTHHQIFHGMSKGPGTCKLFLSIFLALKTTTKLNTTKPTILRLLLSTLLMPKTTRLTCLLHVIKRAQTALEAANLPKDRMAQAKLVLRPQTPRPVLLRSTRQVLPLKAAEAEAQRVLRPQTPPQLLPLRASQRTIIRQAISPKAVEADRLKMGKVSLQGETESLAYDC